MRTSGPVTSTLIPMAAMDDLVGALVFFLVIAVVTARTSTRQIPVFVVVLLVFFPVILGAAIGFLTGKLLCRIHSPKSSVIATSAMILGSTAAGLILNWYVLPAPVDGEAVSRYLECIESLFWPLVNQYQGGEAIGDLPSLEAISTQVLDMVLFGIVRQER